jgi:phosphatidylglycerol---prolipoprotein diacylglyceryl transferase
MNNPSIDSILSPFCYFLGYCAGAAAFWWLARQRGLDSLGVASVMLVGLIGGLVSANIVQILVTSEPGKTVIGAVAGGYLTIILYKRWIGLRRPLGDLFAVALSAGEAVGRWGCYFGGCCYGKVSRLPLAIWQHDAWRYPTQIYSSIAAAVTFAVLVYSEKRAFLQENALFYIQGAMFCAFRFVIEFFRVGNIEFAGLTAAQIACLVGLCFFGYKLNTMLYKTGVSVAV